MKNHHIIIPTILLFLIFACQPITQEKDSETEILTEQQINEIDVNNLEILVIDECEYIFYKKSKSSNQGFGFMTHKGNCKNTIHIYKLKTSSDI